MVVEVVSVVVVVVVTVVTVVVVVASHVVVVGIIEASFGHNRS